MRTSRIPQMPRQSNTDIRPRDSAETRLAAFADDFDVPNNSVLEFFGCHECLLAGLDEARDNAPTCGGGRADHPSQRRRLLEDAVGDIPMQQLLGSRMDLNLQQRLKILHQLGVVQEASSRVPID